MKWTLRDLFTSTIKLSANRKNPPTSPKPSLDKIIPFAGTNTCLFQISMNGVTVKARHRVNVFFYGLEISRVPKENFIETEDKTGKYWIEKPQVYTTPVLLRCTCPDHFFTWGWWNFYKKALFGPKQKPYIRKTKNWPERNPKKYPGFCKHVFWAIRIMQNSHLWK
jgi:hypothetical protein